MAAPSSEHILALVQQALTDIDAVPVAATVRRTVRIASLLGDTELAVHLGLELKPSGGHPPANAEMTRRLMADPALWNDPTGPNERAMLTYSNSRMITSGPDQGKIMTHSLVEVDAYLALFENDQRIPLDGVITMRGIRERARHTAFTALCAWERQFNYVNVNEQIFERFRSRVDELLAHGAPAVLDQFAAVYRRLREATHDPAAPVGEDLAQAVTTCRRILKAVADHLLPGVHGATAATGSSLDDSAYRNRIYQFIQDNVASEPTAKIVKASLGGIFERFTAVDQLANKGVHADLGVSEAELCAISTYLIAGELLALVPSAPIDAGPGLPA